LVLGAACFLGAGYSSAFLGLDKTFFTHFGYPMVAFGSYLVLFHTLQNLREPGPRGYLFRGMAYLGKVSYGLYIYHGFIAGLVGALVSKYTPVVAPGCSTDYIRMLGSAVVAFLLTVLLAHVSYTFFESRFLRLKKRFTPLAGFPNDITEKPSFGGLVVTLEQP
jgi:peptidoglycan/LPS O-acetylase OafA/YrhL